MFMGISSYRGVGRVDSYASAEAAFAKAQRTPTGKLRSPKSRGYGEPAGFPLGLTSRGRTIVHQLDDKSIAFRLYQTDVVTWHPDNSVSVENFGSVTTSAFASSFLPWGIYLRRPSRNGGDEGITYAPMTGEGWRDRMICFGFTVRFVAFTSAIDGREVWLPDETTLRDIRLPRLDRKAARAAVAGLPFAEFENYLAMAPRHIRIEHDGPIGGDIDACVDALKARDFRRAVETLPLIEEPSGFGLARTIRDCALPVITPRRDLHVTMGSIRKLRLAIYDTEGCYDVETAKTMPLAHYERRMRLGRQIDGYSSRWGVK